MTRKSFSILLLAALVVTLLVVLVGCASPSGTDAQGADEGTSTADNTAAGTAITVTDQTGGLVTLDKPADRVVALTASACEIVYALGAGDTVVGRGEYCDWPAEALDVPAVSSGTETNIEQIIALQPDLVLMASMDQTPDQVQQIKDAGIQVYVSDARDIAQTYESILHIGQLMGKNAEASSIVDGMKQTFEALAAKQLSGTIYFEVSPLEYGLWTAGKGTFMNEVAELIGLENIFADLDDWAEVSEEQVLQRNPDFIVTVGMYFGSGPTPEEEIMGRPNWKDVTAVSKKQVLDLSNNELSRPGPRLAQGAQALYDFVANS